MSKNDENHTSSPGRIERVFDERVGPQAHLDTGTSADNRAPRSRPGDPFLVNCEHYVRDDEAARWVAARDSVAYARAEEQNFESYPTEALIKLVGQTEYDRILHVSGLRNVDNGKNSEKNDVDIYFSISDEDITPWIAAQEKFSVITTENDCVICFSRRALFSVLGRKKLMRFFDKESKIYREGSGKKRR